jgi:uncharacterized membrane protein YcjF (UPF0283 family)
LKASKGILIHRMRQPKPRKPGITDIEAAGSLIGLSENDVKEVYNVSKSSRLKQHVTRSFLLFLFSLLAVIIIAYVIFKFFRPIPPVYMYAVRKKELIKAKRLMFQGVLSS